MLNFLVTDPESFQLIFLLIPIGNKENLYSHNLLYIEVPLKRISLIKPGLLIDRQRY